MAPTAALFGHITPKYSTSKETIRGVSVHSTLGLMALSTPHSSRFSMHSGAGRMAALAVSNAAIAVDTTAGFTSTQPASPCNVALSMVTLSAEAADPTPNQLAAVAAVLIADATPEAWWLAPSVVHAV
ncbi:Uncharacterised protein [Mycobacterium tuberculosis]|uniref:Uncharacterized protein n=1 Tax=Mycobacterium tuberculosis TaxID=1773 RepID=A0A0T7LJR8_MYCTX|nr:Uncharacterised protein [Mycobacterium tuberculosis]CFU99250.1 Uncharacterised protein [Mycobacterium tuberculosis]CKN52192.1 Uncharacterised protein [Mycobacterium tuberculosis]CKO82790.1 Uncharacterised protein [Mycobacterium tuberculosis]CKQ90381.1 Uncharacterised protein [Mycobacterium tuberculosis]